MFIYFPEFLFKTFKLHINNSFPKVSSKHTEQVITTELNSAKFANLISDFKINKIKLPVVKLEHCSSISISNFLNFKSSYNNLDNTIKICTNQLEHVNEIQSVINKELIYAYDNNIKFKNQDMTLNNQACTTIRSCR